MLRPSRHRLLFDIVAALLLASLLLRGLTPPGYMPGAVGLKLCTAVGLVDASIPNAPHRTDGAEDHAKGLCPFAAAASAASPPQIAWHVGLPDEARRVVPALFGAPITRGISLLPWPRGPPALALIRTTQD